jgi:hypothetical protein
MKRSRDSPPFKKNQQKDNFVDLAARDDKNVITFRRIQRWRRGEYSFKGAL